MYRTCSQRRAACSHPRLGVGLCRSSRSTCSRACAQALDGKRRAAPHSREPLPSGGRAGAYRRVRSPRRRGARSRTPCCGHGFPTVKADSSRASMTRRDARVQTPRLRSMRQGCRGIRSSLASSPRPPPWQAALNLATPPLTRSIPAAPQPARNSGRGTDQAWPGQRPFRDSGTAKDVCVPRRHDVDGIQRPTLPEQEEPIAWATGDRSAGQPRRQHPSRTTSWQLGSSRTGALGRLCGRAAVRPLGKPGPRLLSCAGRIKREACQQAFGPLESEPSRSQDSEAVRLSPRP